jgi:hypothetical protein
MCSDPLARSTAFLVCRTLPAMRFRMAHISAMPSESQRASQPLLTCGVPSDAVFIGLRQTGTNQVIVFINDWGHPSVEGAPLQLGAAESLDLTVIFDLDASKLTITEGERMVLSSPITASRTASCDFLGGVNPIGGAATSARFAGKVTVTEEFPVFDAR